MIQLENRTLFVARQAFVGWISSSFSPLSRLLKIQEALKIKSSHIFYLFGDWFVEIGKLFTFFTHD